MKIDPTNFSGNEIPTDNRMESARESMARPFNRARIDDRINRGMVTLSVVE